jgi:hypothetical protein
LAENESFDRREDYEEPNDVIVKKEKVDWIPDALQSNDDAWTEEVEFGVQQVPE